MRFYVGLVVFIVCFTCYSLSLAQSQKQQSVKELEQELLQESSKSPKAQPPSSSSSAQPAQPAQPAQQYFIDPSGNRQSVQQTEASLQKEMFKMPIDELKKAKKKTEQYREVLEGYAYDEMPKTNFSKVFVNNESTHVIKMRHNIMTRIQLLSEKDIKMENIGLGNRDYFKIEIRDNNIFIVPVQKFNFTNMHIIGTKNSYQFLLKEIPYESNVDSYVVVKRFDEKPTTTNIVNSLYTNVLLDNVKYFFPKNKMYHKVAKVIGDNTCYLVFPGAYVPLSDRVEFFLVNSEDTVVKADCRDEIKLIRRKDGKQITVSNFAN